jgi:hypothetical protein
MRIPVNFDSLASGLISGDIAQADLDNQGYMFKKGKAWASVERALRDSAELALKDQDDRAYLLAERLRKVFHLSLALTPTVVREEAIALKNAMRHVMRNTNQFRALERRVQLLAREVPNDTDNHDYRVAMYALDIVATRENITLSFKEAA